METSWIIIGILAVCVVILIVYVIKRNSKDEKDVEEFLNETEGYRHRHEHHTDDDI